MQTKAKQRKR